MRQPKAFRVDLLLAILVLFQRYPYHPRVSAVTHKKDPGHCAESTGGRLHPLNVKLQLKLVTVLKKLIAHMIEQKHNRTSETGT